MTYNECITEINKFSKQVKDGFDFHFLQLKGNFNEQQVLGMVLYASQFGLAINVSYLKKNIQVKIFKLFT